MENMVTGVGGRFSLPEGLNPGTYTITEVQPPEGYYLNADNTIQFTISSANMPAGVILTFYNEAIPFIPVTIEKLDATSLEYLQGAEFELRDANGNVIRVGMITGPDGRYIIPDGLRPGTYTIIEVVPPDGYLLNEFNDQEILLELGHLPDGMTISFFNNPVPRIPVVIFKMDAENETLLPGAEFVITDENGEIVFEGTTNESGMIMVPNGLLEGTYTITEKTPPEGYLLGDIYYLEFTVTEDDVINGIMITFYNELIPVGPEPPTPPPPPEIITDPEPPPPPPPPTVTPPTTPTTPPPTTEPPIIAAPIVDLPPTSTPTADTRLESQSSNILQDILDGNVPLAAGGGRAWSLLNLMMSLVAIFSSIIMTVNLIVKRREVKEEMLDMDEDELADEESIEIKRSRLNWLKVPAIVAGIIPGALFLIYEDIRLPVTWITQWTPIIGAFFLIFSAFLIIQLTIKKQDNTDLIFDDDEDDIFDPMNKIKDALKTRIETEEIN
jgi:hypothetical protein